MLCDLDKVCPALVVKIYVQWLRFKIGGQELYEVWGPYHLIVALLQERGSLNLITIFRECKMKEDDNSSCGNV